MRTVKGIVSLFSLVVLVSASSASAGGGLPDLMSFGYTDLNGSFSAGSSLFTAVDDGDSDGDVTRIIAPASTAFFNGDGAVGFPSGAAFNLSATLTGLTSAGATVAPGDGSITLTDVNGDTFTGNIEGDWVNVSGSAHFNGILTNVTPNNTSLDGTFDGNSGSFSMNFPATPPFTGNVITLEFGNWFTTGAGVPQSFSGATTLTAGAIVPEPATLAMLALGGLAALTRVRRKA